MLALICSGYAGKTFVVPNMAGLCNGRRLHWRAILPRIIVLPKQSGFTPSSSHGGGPQIGRDGSSGWRRSKLSTGLRVTHQKETARDCPEMVLLRRNQTKETGQAGSNGPAGHAHRHFRQGGGLVRKAAKLAP